MAKLQTLKQNTDPSERKEVCTKAQSPMSGGSISGNKTRNQRNSGSGGGGGGAGGGGGGGSSSQAPPTQQQLHSSNKRGSEERLSSEVISSPRGRQSFR